jgi:hypothetical protein
MEPCIVESLPVTRPSALGGFFKLLVFAARKMMRTDKLDLEVMPDRVKRDLGFLDGREPRYEDDRLR